MPAPPYHLVGVWNPSYEADAMDAHVAILLQAARELRDGRRHENDVFVWWGKVASRNRRQPLPHLTEILALDGALEARDERDEPPELHLYLTDYRSLYVAHVAGVTADDMSGEEGYVPEYYREKELACDCWFQLWDIRRLVLDDTPAVAHELGRLRNVRYHEARVSLYGGMVELPLLVTRDDDARFFDETTRERLTDGRYWVEFDAERGATGAMQRDLRENRFGNTAWSALDPAARSFVATAEQLLRAHRADAAFDLGTVLVDLAKAFEVQTNAIVRRALRDAPEEARLTNVEGRTVDLALDGPWTLGELARAIGGERAVHLYLRNRLVHGDWFTASLPPILAQLAELRNPAAHGGRVDRDEIVRLRNQFVGVGCRGDLLDLAMVRVP